MENSKINQSHLSGEAAIAREEYPIKLQAKRYIELGKESAITLRKNIP
jgi:hypothetical protein